MGSRPREISLLFALEKCLQPKNPELAEKGDGCAASRIKLPLLINSFFCLA